MDLEPQAISELDLMNSKGVLDFTSYYYPPIHFANSHLPFAVFARPFLPSAQVMQMIIVDVTTIHQ